jgi:hypothetical protein
MDEPYPFRRAYSLPLAFTPAVSIWEGPWLPVFRRTARARLARPVKCFLSSRFAALRCSSKRASPLLQRLSPLFGRHAFLVSADAPSSLSLSHRTIKPFRASAPHRGGARLSCPLPMVVPPSRARPFPTRRALCRHDARALPAPLRSADPQQPPRDPPVEQRRPRDHTRPAHPHQHVRCPLLLHQPIRDGL